ncbi:MAG: cytochrome-c oxidase [Candidatus Tectimicrobiota bacterium]|nr:MAG: cytochrome-c oxidase [Candidatus Tectomicrobia bacterium]
MLRWLPESVSTFSGDIDALIRLIYYTVGAWFVLTFAVILIFLVRYRYRPGRRAVYLPGNTLAQSAWVLVPGLVVLLLDIGIDIYGERVWEAVKLHQPPAAVQVRVTGKQFAWEVLYPGPDGRFGTADDRQLNGELHVPVHQVVHVTLGAEDVIHSFFLPHLRLKQDALPGRQLTVWFEATVPGTYPLVCAELCGTGHTGMFGRLIVHTPEDYQAWVKAQWPSS